MLTGTFLILLFFCQRYSPTAVPIGDNATETPASTANTTISEEDPRYPPEGLPFQPSPPNPLELLYTSWQPPRTNKNVPIYLIEDCVDMGIWKLDSLIAMRGGDAPIRPFTTDGVFKCQGLFLGLAIEFYPQLREPTYQQVKWSLQAMKQASSNETFNYHREAVIYVLDTRSSTRPSERYLPVSSIGMTLSMGPTQPVAVT